MSETEKFLEGFSAHKILQHVYGGTMERIIIDIQAQIDDKKSWKANPDVPGNKLPEKEIVELDIEIDDFTNMVKSLLRYYASYNHPSREMQNLCTRYEIKTFDDINREEIEKRSKAIV